ncbi:MAG: hypothetical protein AABY22_02915, partial [Nanoarchaeota archaeon]
MTPKIDHTQDLKKGNQFKLCKFCNNKFYRNDNLINFGKMTVCMEIGCRKMLEREQRKNLYRKRNNLEDSKICKYCGSQFYR